MTFLILIIIVSAVAYLPQYVLGDRSDYRIALRHGMAGGFIFTGLDHFLTPSRYVAMLPDFLSAYAVPLVYLSGAAELVGAIGLLIPLAVYRRLRLPNLRRWAGIGLALLLSVIVIANFNVAVQGTQVQGLAFGRWYYWFRLLLQPLFIAWALFVGGVLRPRRATATPAPQPLRPDLPLPH